MRIYIFLLNELMRYDMSNKFKNNNKYKVIASVVGAALFTITNAHTAAITPEQTIQTVHNFLSFNPAVVSQAREIIHEGPAARACFTALPIDEQSADILETATRILHKIPESALTKPNTRLRRESIMPEHAVVLNGLEYGVLFLMGGSATLTFEEVQAARVIYRSTAEGSCSTEPDHYTDVFQLDTAGNPTLLISRLERNMTLTHAPDDLKAIQLPTITVGDMKNGLFVTMDNLIHKDGVTWEIIRPEATATGYNAITINTFLDHSLSSDQGAAHVSEYNLAWGNIRDDILANINCYNRGSFIFPLYAFDSAENAWKIYVKYEFLMTDPMNNVINVPLNLCCRVNV
jgi:hypothetical protein